ncbi:MAG: hypothetical protein JNM85_01275 [Chthonomonas sp.]|nr:hypothetical protein [Chthonomonas sp.]
MKQNDWIVIGVCGVFAIGMVVVALTQARTPETPAKPTVVPTAKVEIPAPALTMANGLPGGSDQQGGGGGGSLAGGGAPGGGPGGGLSSTSDAGGKGGLGFSTTEGR